MCYILCHQGTQEVCCVFDFVSCFISVKIILMTSVGGKKQHASCQGRTEYFTPYGPDPFPLKWTANSHRLQREQGWALLKFKLGKVGWAGEKQNNKYSSSEFILGVSHQLEQDLLGLQSFYPGNIVAGRERVCEQRGVLQSQEEIFIK